MADAFSDRAMFYLRVMFAWFLRIFDNGSLLAELQVKPTWVDQIRVKQLSDESLVPHFRHTEDSRTSNFGLNSDGVLYFRCWICMPNDVELRLSIMREAHSSLYAMHPCGNKMYRDLQESSQGSEYPIGFQYCVASSDRLSDHVIQILEDMLRSCVINFWGSWEDYLSLAEFACNNNFQVSIQMEPYEAFYSPTGRHKSYTDLKRHDIEYSVSDQVILKVSPWKKVFQFGRKDKLSPRFIGPYHILKCIRSISYQIKLPAKLNRIHDVFHVSMLRRYQSDPSHIVPVEENLTFEEEHVQILDQDVKVLQRKIIPLVKILWRNHDIEEATWEPEDSIRQ
ncbi:uncharacterized protein LOC105775420 [Gossypium raimondii]|uniref:uncharacterized protein LOC105775420 n=1 Tax=Gossypium raimondii TaxID=29730 RepID=UPI00063AF287|nr:uncharacterized protein LOC105775420 [Gossypium raimondii]